jgi:sialate O-acetylesterase
MTRSTFTVILFCMIFLHTSCKEEPLTEVFMPKFFADHMVVQRNQPIRVWGDGTPGKRVVGKFNNQEKETEIDKDGYWKLEFDPMPASGPFILNVNGKVIRDIQVGDVWVAGGQSNMEWVLSAGVEGLQEEIADSEYPLIRFFKIPHDYDAKEKTDVRGGEWKMANPDNILNFSAVAWFFAKKNHLEKGVPVGIIESNWGGTPAQGWTSAHKLVDFPPYQEKAKDVVERKDYWIQEIIDNKVRELKRNELVAAPQNGEIKGVVNTNFDDSDWQVVNLPGDNPFSDIAWFRKKFTLTDIRKCNLKPRRHPTDGLYLPQWRKTFIQGLWR